MISVQGLSKRYARNVAVDNISFEVQKGQIVGFLGPNGAGKTTTMRVLTCFLPPTSGTANIAGFDVQKHVREGDPAHTLINVAEEEGADLIAVGARGQGALRRFALGSVSAKLSHNTPVSRPDEVLAARNPILKWTAEE